jgi:LPS sulfotransferase NodH
MTFQKNASLEELLAQLSRVLEPAEQRLREELAIKHKVHPTIIKIGSPRVGGTLLTQWVAASGGISVPTNFLSRFYAAPAIGALIYEMLTNPRFDYKGEFSDLMSRDHFKSDVGKTAGFSGAHEFWYFWRHRLHLPDVPCSTDEFLTKSNLSDFNQALSALQAISGKPYFLKGHLVNFYLKKAGDRFENCVYLHLRRDLLHTVRSLYKARISWTGTDTQWFSHKPPQFESLRSIAPVRQVAAQIYLIEKEMAEAKNALGSRYLTLTYEELCLTPAESYEKLVEHVNRHAEHPISRAYHGPKSFPFSASRDDSLDPQIEQALTWCEKTFGTIQES